MSFVVYFYAEIHHVRTITDLKQKHRRGKIDFCTMQMTSTNRKQTPLCKSHHISLYGNKLTVAEIIAFKKGVEKLSQFS